MAEKKIPTPKELAEDIRIEEYDLLSELEDKISKQESPKEKMINKIKDYLRGSKIGFVIDAPNPEQKIDYANMIKSGSNRSKKNIKEFLKMMGSIKK